MSEGLACVCVCQRSGCWYEQTDAVSSFKKHHLWAEIKTLCCCSVVQLRLKCIFILQRCTIGIMNFDTVMVLCICVNVSVSHGLNACVCLHLYGRRPGSLAFLCIAALVQRLSFGLLIPFYSTGIMCYSNPSPIWGVWRRHEDDVTARTRGDTENHRPSLSLLSMRDRLQRLHASMITLEVFAHSRSPLSEEGLAACQGVTASREGQKGTVLYLCRQQTSSYGIINHGYNKRC